MEFKTPYVLAMREQAPRMFNQLVRSGKMEEHLLAKAEEFMATLIEFPPEEKKRRVGTEPPDKLYPLMASKIDPSTVEWVNSETAKLEQRGIVPGSPREN